MNLERQAEIALLRMNAGKGNAINPDMLRRLDEALDAFEGSHARALVITGHASTFCAGLDLPAVGKLDRDGVGDLMETMHRVFLRLFRLPRPVVAAVNGHAIAGGCVLVQQADYRVLAAGSFKIGLNETRLGVGLPAVVVESARYHLPAASLLPVALEGRLFTPEEAHALGLVDEVAEDAEARAMAKALELASIPGAAYAQVKAALRAPFVARMEAAFEWEHERWLDTCFSAEAKKRIGAVVALLSG